MNIESIRRQVRREGVAFPRLGLNAAPSGPFVDGRNTRILLPSSSGQVIVERGYETFFTTAGVQEEVDDLTPRAMTAVKFLVDLKGEVKPGVQREWDKALLSLRDMSVTAQRAFDLLNAYKDADRESGSLVDNIINTSLRLGVRIEGYRALDRFRRLTPQAGFEPEAEGLVVESLDLIGFSDLGAVVVPMPDISIADIMDDKNWKNIPPDKLLDFAMEGGLARRRVDLNRIYPEHYTFAHTHPQTTMRLLHDASFVLNNGFSLDAMGLKGVNKIPGLGIAQKGMMRFADRLGEVQRLFSDTLFNPETEHFDVFSESVARRLDGDKDEAIMVLYRLGLNKGVAIPEPYRRSRRLIAMGSGSEFYGGFGDSVKTMVEEGRLSETFYIPTQDDLAGILDEEKGVGLVSEPAVHQTMAGRVSSIFQRKNIPEYGVDVTKVDWGNLVPPQEANIKFQSQPHRFSVALGWKNDVGESLDVNLNFDTKANKFDWNFLEGPEDQTMVAMKSSSFVIAQNMLTIMEAEVRTQTEEKRKAEVAKPKLTVIKGTKRERVQDEVYGLRKIVRQEARDSKPAALQIVPKETPTEIKREIEIPEQDEFDSMLAVLSTVDKGIVKVALDDFNEKGIGKFTRKKSRDEDGEPLYTLAVGCTVPKGVRVLVKESSSSAGQRTFEILDIRYRKDIYRKAGI